MTSLVSVLAGSKSDEAQVKKVIETLSGLGVEHDQAYLSCHRNPTELDKYIQNSKADVFIAIAGLSASLPGYIAARTVKPVIGVPVEKALGGLDSLLSIVQMPKGIPVACVAINGAENAAYLSARIISLKDEKIKKESQEVRLNG